jgi:rod shape-determining protein MreD
MRPTALGLLRAAYIALAALLTVTVVPRLGIPASWAPDLVVVGVVATALLRGPTHGALVGLLAGWVVELVPPVGRPLGLTALAMLLAGAAAGALGRSSLRPGLRAALAVVAASLVPLTSRLAVTAAAEGRWDIAAAMASLTATAGVAVVVLPTMILVDRALVRRRLG